MTILHAAESCCDRDDCVCCRKQCTQCWYAGCSSILVYWTLNGASGAPCVCSDGPTLDPVWPAKATRDDAILDTITGQFVTPPWNGADIHVDAECGGDPDVADAAYAVAGWRYTGQIRDGACGDVRVLVALLCNPESYRTESQPGWWWYVEVIDDDTDDLLFAVCVDAETDCLAASVTGETNFGTDCTATSVDVQLEVTTSPCCKQITGIGEEVCCYETMLSEMVVTSFHEWQCTDGTPGTSTAYELSGTQVNLHVANDCSVRTQWISTGTHTLTEYYGTGTPSPPCPPTVAHTTLHTWTGYVLVKLADGGVWTLQIVTECDLYHPDFAVATDGTTPCPALVLLLDEWDEIAGAIQDCNRRIAQGSYTSGGVTWGADIDLELSGNVCCNDENDECQGSYEWSQPANGQCP